MKKISKQKNKIKRTQDILLASVLTAVFTAMALVIRTVAGIRIPMLGANGVQISFGGIFTFFPAIMFGPIYGGTASALCDIIGYWIKPDGAYVPWFTVVAFIGGMIKGYIWRFLTRKREKKITAAIKVSLVCLFAIILVFGGIFSLSLKNDGIINGIISKQESLPYEDEVNAKELSHFSYIATSLARYNRDTLTFKSLTPDENGKAYLPSHISSKGTELAITKIDASIFNIEGLKELYIPATCTSLNIPENFEFTNSSLTVIFEKPSTNMTDFAGKYSLSIKVDAEAFKENLLEVSSFAKKYETEALKISSSDRYRKYLAGYINFTTIGFILTGVLGILFVGIGVLVSFFTKKKKSERRSIYMKVLPAILISGLTVTTINTYVLLETVVSYTGRLFWILYIPRLAEELFVSVIQAYIITLLLSVLSANSLFRKLLGLQKHINSDEALSATIAFKEENEETVCSEEKNSEEKSCQKEQNQTNL